MKRLLLCAILLAAACACWAHCHHYNDGMVCMKGDDNSYEVIEAGLFKQSYLVTWHKHGDGLYHYALWGIKKDKTLSYMTRMFSTELPYGYKEKHEKK